MNRNSQKAFTLIEVLLGLLIFSIIALSLYSVFSGGIMLGSRAQKESQGYQQMRFVLDSMTKDLENMIAYDTSNSYQSVTSFVGKEEEMTFLIATPNGLKAVSYYLTDPQAGKINKVIVGQIFKKNVTVQTTSGGDEKVKYLIRRERSILSYFNSDPENDEQIEILSMDFKEDGLRFSYGFLEGDEKSPTIVWKNDWDLNYNPSNIRMDIEMKAKREDEGEGKSFKITKEVLIPSGYWGSDKVQE